jgi:inorganic pyrophosphatase
MADYDAVFDYGKDGEFVNHVNEIAKGSMLKVEYDREHKVFVLDRVEPDILLNPAITALFLVLLMKMVMHLIRYF